MRFWPVDSNNDSNPAKIARSVRELRWILQAYIDFADARWWTRLDRSRIIWEQEVVGSIPATPTTFQDPVCPQTVSEANSLNLRVA